MLRDLILFGFFDFVRLHAWCGYCSIVCWREWGFRLKLDAQGQGGGKTLDRDRQRVRVEMWKLCLSTKFPHHEIR